MINFFVHIFNVVFGFVVNHLPTFNPFDFSLSDSLTNIISYSKIMDSIVSTKLIFSLLFTFIVLELSVVIYRFVVRHIPQMQANETKL